MVYPLETGAFYQYTPQLPGTLTALHTDNSIDGVALKALSHGDALAPQVAAPSLKTRFKERFVRIIKTPLSPTQLLGTLLLPFYKPARHREVYWERLNEFSGGEERANAAKVLAHYVNDYHFHLFRYPPHLNQDKWHWTAAIFRGRNGEYTWYGKDFMGWAEKNEELFFHAIESTLLKAFGGLSQRIASIATDSENINYDYDFVFNTTVKLIRNTVDHISRINEARKQYGLEVDKDMLRAEFGLNLHRGLSVDTRLNAAERREWTLMAFFQEISKRLIDIALPNGADDVEFPGLFKGVIYSMLQEGILPNALLDITEEILDPYNLDSLLLTFLEAYNEPKDPIAQPIDVPLAKMDKKQKRINKLCEELVSEILNLFEPKLAKIFVRIPKLREKLGESIGLAIRDQASHRWTVDGILNWVVEVWLPTFHPGEWRTIDGKKIFVPHQRMKTPDGEVISWPARDFAFTHFAKNEVERREQLETLETEREELEKQLLEALDKTLNREIKRAVPDALGAFWVKVRPTIDPWVEGYFGKPGVKVAKTITSTVRLSLKIAFLSVALLFYPLTRFVGIIVDQYTKRKSKDIVKCLQMDIHRNLFYTHLDTLIRSLSLNRQKRLPPYQPKELS